MSTPLLRQYPYASLPFTIFGFILDSRMSKLRKAVHVNFTLTNICGPLLLELGNGLAERAKWYRGWCGAFLYRCWIVHLIKKIQLVKTCLIAFNFLLASFSDS